MTALSSSRHEHFAQLVAKGASAIEAYVKSGYSKAGARQSASRLLTNADILRRIEELKTAIADQVVKSEIRKRSWRVLQLQSDFDRMSRLIEDRAAMYGGQMGESRSWRVHDEAEEKEAIAQGFSEPAYPDTPETTDAEATPSSYPKTLIHPGYPNGGATGMLVKDYRGKNAEQEIWKFDAALVAQRRDTLKNAAIEEGQWSEKRDLQGTLTINVLMDKINAGRQRVAEEKRTREIQVVNIRETVETTG